MPKPNGDKIPNGAFNIIEGIRINLEMAELKLGELERTLKSPDYLKTMISTTERELYTKLEEIQTSLILLKRQQRERERP